MSDRLLDYHPIRYEFHLGSLMDYVFLEYNKLPKSKQNFLNLGDNIFIPELKEMVEIKDTLLSFGMDNSDWVEYQEELFGAYAFYESDGENIIHLQPELVEMFRKTGVSEISIESLKTPYKSFYLYFGDIKDFKIDSNTYIDGAYIGYDSEYDTETVEVYDPIFIYLTTRNTQIQQDSYLDEIDVLNLESHFYYSLSHDPENGVHSIGKMLDEATTDNSVESFKIEVLHLYKPHLKEITNIIINALCFMDSEHNDMKTRFNEGCPQAFTDKLEKAKTEKQKNRIISKARSQGFVRLNFIGDSYKKYHSSLFPSDKTLAPH